MSPEIEHGTNNVFADLDMRGAADRQTKTRLALEINGILKARNLKETETGRLLGIPQSKVSAFMNYRLDRFSVEHLMGLLTTLERGV